MQMPEEIVRQVRAANAGRDPALRARKYAAMADDVFAFLRGTCHLFYARLPRARLTRSAPAAWACGDLHLANFGSYRGDNHLVYFDLNDFDEGWLRSSGRQGSAMADSLIRYWSKPRRSRKLLALATQCSEQIEEDWEAYRRAYAAGHLG